MAVFWSPHRHHGFAADLRQHVGADILDPLVELVAQRVGPGQAGPGLREIPGLEQRQQPLVFLTEIATEIAGHALDPIVDPAEPGVVGFGRDIVDDRIDQGARRLRFLFDFLPLRLIDFSLIRKECPVGRRLHPARSPSGAAPAPAPANGYSSAPDAHTLRRICC